MPGIFQLSRKTRYTLRLPVSAPLWNQTFLFLPADTPFHSRKNGGSVPLGSVIPSGELAFC